MTHQEKKPLPDYETMTPVTGNAPIDNLLKEIAAACMHLEEAGHRVDVARDDMEKALSTQPKNEGQIAALKTQIDALMAHLAISDDKQIPDLLHKLGMIGQENVISSGVLKQAEKRIRAMGRKGDLNIEGEPHTNTAQDDDASPWADE